MELKKDFLEEVDLEVIVKPPIESNQAKRKGMFGKSQWRDEEEQVFEEENDKG